MHPTRFDGIEPGAFDGQQKRQQTNVARLFGMPVIGADPAPEPLAFMPTRMVPDHDDNSLAFLPCNSQQALQESPGGFTARLTIAHIQIDLVRIVTNCPITRQGLLRFLGFGCALHQSKRLPFLRPGMKVWLGKARKPTLILLEQEPCWFGDRQGL